MPMRLSELLEHPTDLPSDPEIRGLAFDSRRVTPGALFVAVPGTAVDGHRFIPEARARGAAAVIAERPCDGGPIVQVPSARRALGIAADRFYGRPSQDVAVVGITGTNGKTTTAFLLTWILEAHGFQPSLLGTVESRIAGRRTPSRQTTPDPLSLHAALAETRDAGGRALVMEVSSHALDQERAAGARFAVGVFTNLSQDHLDYHGDMEAYRAAKGRLFAALDPRATAVLNAQDPSTARFAARTQAAVIRYGRRPEDGLRAELGRRSLEGSELLLSYRGKRTRLRLPIIGDFNIENALAAVGAARALGLSIADSAAALSAFPGVPGRLERVSSPGQPAVFVDYAHTEDALDRVLATLRPLTRGRLRVVFGCGGDRDRSKRPLMAMAAARRADVITLTSDNPRGEDPERILDDAAVGLGEAAGRHRRIVDRAEAIARAVAETEAGDLLLIAGKGHEAEQVFADGARPFDDREVARAALDRYHRASRSGRAAVA